MNWFFLPKIIETVNAVRSNYDIISNILPSKKDYTEDQLEQVKLMRRSLLKDLKNQRIQNRNLEKKVMMLFLGTIATILLYGIYGYDTQTFARNTAFIFYTLTLIAHMLTTYTPNFRHNERLKTDLEETSYFVTIYQEVVNLERACKENDILLNEKARFFRWGTTLFILGVIAMIISFLL